MLQRDICIELLKQFPTACTLTIAKIAYRDNPSVFPSLEAARGAVRVIRGANGKGDLKFSVKEHVRPHRKPGDPFSKIPDAITSLEDWKAVKIEGVKRALVLADIHIPYHDRPALLSALRHGKKAKVDCIIINGDALDVFSLSFWEKDPRERQFKREIDAGREFFVALREAFPKARIIFKEGNHEERLIRYMSVKAPELLGIAEFEIPSMFGFRQLGVEWIDEKRPMKLGKLNIIHGHEYPFAISNPVNPARGFFLRAKAHCLGSHFHQKSQHTEKTVEEENISTWSTGCLCNIHPDYRRLNNWVHGFAVIETGDGGTFNVENYSILGGQVYR